MLEKLDRLTGGENEGLDSEKIQLQQSAEKLHKAPGTD